MQKHFGNILETYLFLDMEAAKVVGSDEGIPMKHSVRDLVSVHTNHQNISLSVFFFTTDTGSYNLRWFVELASFLIFHKMHYGHRQKCYIMNITV